ncbi:reverse transcriptase N-terminal domain-containing protein [Nostoc sp. 'Peltigera malacea cyanobiont' DB3992]|uniref:reverse transcriptase N-terminal domain-containing protein n=1 Tax=Nostoc sp. 'Peltigera malacea cyanobiont' DB3992 TaxID=1206980 RepID=UPI00211DEA64|nr:reverse transcriptase N-terminal domain-containing protein [Nostoc sp. 'Peltigera malacea cyanobiont' DB3992]
MNKPNSDLVMNTEGWKTINWRQAERYVFKLQKRIYAASRRGDVKQCRKLQKTLMRSWSNRVLAVRRVTVENQGKKTAGVDGIKSLPPKARFELAGQLKLTGKSKPTRRVWIPKPGREEKRPLGIPVMYDRALQAVAKAALEPEWEAVFEPNSYGFRPGRSCHDAIKQIKNCIQTKAKYVLDADIAKCFDRINHEVLLQKLNIKGKVRQQIKAWLKSGVIDRGAFTATSEGTPQGGVISPLLANIALHGLEEKLKQYAETLPLKKNRDIIKKT